MQLYTPPNRISIPDGTSSPPHQPSILDPNTLASMMFRHSRLAGRQRGRPGGDKCSLPPLILFQSPEDTLVSMPRPLSYQENHANLYRLKI